MQSNFHQHYLHRYAHRSSPLIMTLNLLLGAEGMDIWHLRPHLAIFVNYDLFVNPQTKDRTYWNRYSLT